MKEYGFINSGGYLVSRIVSEYTERYRDGDGKESERTILISEQVPHLIENGWKPVDPIDEEKLICKDGYIIRLVPYDAGDHIAYEYKEVFDTQKVKNEIAIQKEFLSGSDYKISKCYEASLLGESLPYDLIALHSERQAARDRVNELEAVIGEMTSINI